MIPELDVRDVRQPDLIGREGPLVLIPVRVDIIAVPAVGGRDELLQGLLGQPRLLHQPLHDLVVDDDSVSPQFVRDGPIAIALVPGQDRLDPIQQLAFPLPLLFAVAGIVRRAARHA